MRNLFGIVFLSCLASCYFGANDYGEEIMKDFHLLGWDNRNWIAFSKDHDSLFEVEKIIIRHDVFAVGNNENFIIVKQHPCENTAAHFMDFDSLAPNRNITNYYIIDTRTNPYKMHQFSNAKQFDKWRTKFGIEDLPYKYISDQIE